MIYCLEKATCGSQIFDYERRKCISLILSKFPRVFIIKEEAPRWPKRYVLEKMNDMFL